MVGTSLLKPTLFVSVMLYVLVAGVHSPV